MNINYKECTDEELVEYYLRFKEDNLLTRELYRRTFEYSQSTLQNRHYYSDYSEMEDDCCDATHKILSKLKKYKPNKSKYKTWVSNVTNNFKIDQYRFQKIRTEKVILQYNTDEINDVLASRQNLLYDIFNESESEKIISNVLTILKNEYGQNYADIYSDMYIDNLKLVEVSSKHKISIVNLKEILEKMNDYLRVNLRKVDLTY